MSDRSVLVLGATGMLGRAAVEQLQRASGGLQVVASSRTGGATSHRYDVAEGADALASVLAAARCAYVVNAIGMLSAAIDRHDPASVAEAISINARFPQLLAVAAERARCRVLHVSTDGVFSGRSAVDYLENTSVDPSDVYGWSKALGEADTDRVLNIRCSIVGRDPRGKGLIEWVMRASADTPLQGYTDYVWTPATVPQLVDFIRAVIVEDRFAALRSAGPVVHFAPNPPLSKFEMVRQIADRLGGRPAVRPALSPSGPCRRVLATAHTYPRASNWSAAVRALLTDVTGVNQT